MHTYGCRFYILPGQLQHSPTSTGGNRRDTYFEVKRCSQPLQSSFFSRTPLLWDGAALSSTTWWGTMDSQGNLFTHVGIMGSGKALHFLPLLIGWAIGCFADNITALAYLRHQGSTRSEVLNKEAQKILWWVENHQISITTWFMSGLQNVVVDAVSQQGQILSTEWTLHQKVSREPWRLGPTIHGSFCHKSEFSGTGLCVAISGPHGSSYRCHPSQLRPEEVICLSFDTNNSLGHNSRQLRAHT